MAVAAATQGGLSPMGAAALNYGSDGWAVLPLAGKTPISGHGFRDATTDARQIVEWWSNWPDSNIGVAIPEGVTVVDVDGLLADTWLKAKDFDLPATLTVRTGRGRHHYYCGTIAKNQTKLEGQPLDLRAGGRGFMVVPPSLHADGGVYKVASGSFSDLGSLAPIPEWIERYSVTDRFDLEAAVRGFDDGERNDRLWRMTGSLRCRGYDQKEALGLLQKAAGDCRPPYAEIGHLEGMVRRCYSSPAPTPLVNSEYSDDSERPPEPDPGLPLEEFLAQAKAHSRASGTHGRTFDFARQALRHPRFVRTSERERRDLVTDLWGEETRWQIMEELDKVTIIPGTKPLEMAFEMAVARPVYVDPDEPLYSRFLSLCFHLRYILRGQDIGLACHKVGALIGCTGKTVLRLRREAEKADVITETEAGTNWRATRFRFNLDVFNSLEHARNEVDR